MRPSCNGLPLVAQRNRSGIRFRRQRARQCKTESKAIRSTSSYISTDVASTFCRDAALQRFKVCDQVAHLFWRNLVSVPGHQGGAVANVALNVGIGTLSIGLAALGRGALASLSGFTYMLCPIVLSIHGTMMGKRRRKIENEFDRLRQKTAGADG